MRQFLPLTFLVLFTTTAMAQPSVKPPKNYALLVGVSGYKKTELRPLPYTPDDVEGFKKALLATGFPEDHVVVMHDRQTVPRYLPDRKRIMQELDLLIEGIRDQDTLVVALSGHGVHFKGDKTGYFCPLDARLDDKSSLIAMEGPGGLFDEIKKCRAKKKLLIVNACRNDPFGDLAQAARKAHFDDEYSDQVPEGIAAIFSCREGQKSYYDPDRKRAIFFDHVIRAWKGEYSKSGEVTLEEIFDHVETKTKIDVNRTLGEKQVPVVKREYTGKWVVSTAGASVSPEPRGEVYDIIRKAIAAKGGADLLNKYKACRMATRGTIWSSGIEAPFVSEYVSQIPDRQRSQVTVTIGGQQTKVVTVLIGNQVRFLVDGVRQETTEVLRKDARRSSLMDRLDQLATLLTDKTIDLKPLGESQIDGTTVVGVLVPSREFGDIKLYFDKSTYLLSRREYLAGDANAPGQESTYVAVMSEYKSYSGIRIPTRSVLTLAGKKYLDVVITDVKLYESLPDKEFED